jgi:hypothetical protein
MEHIKKEKNGKMTTHSSDRDSNSGYSISMFRVLSDKPDYTIRAIDNNFCNGGFRVVQGPQNSTFLKAKNPIKTLMHHTSGLIFFSEYTLNMERGVT